MEQKFSPSFVPIIHKSDFDDVANEFLRKYCPEALEKPMPVPIWDIATKKIQLIVIKDERLSRNFDILGAIALCDGIIDIYNPETEEYEGIEVQKGMVFIDESINHIGRENNTLAHECVHWYKHRRYFIRQNKIEIEHISGFRCLVKDMAQDKSNSWSDWEWMEWQAKNIAPRILMPRETTSIKIDELLQKHGYFRGDGNKLAVLQNVIAELADFFRVSRQSAKIRMIELGYEEAREAAAYENDINPLPVVKNKDKQSYSGCAVHKISSKEAFDEYRKNRRFQEVIKSGLFCYVDGCFVINNEKYIKPLISGGFRLTQYAKDNLSECALTFGFRLSRSYGSYSLKSFSDVLYRSQASDYKKLSSYTSTPLNAGVFDSAEALSNSRKEFEEMYAETRKFTKTFSERVYEIIQVKKWNAAVFKEKTLLDDQTFSRIKNNQYNNAGLDKVIAICVGLNLLPSVSKELLTLAGYALNDSYRTHMAYDLIINSYYGCSIDEVNDMLEAWEIETLGTKSRVRKISIKDAGEEKTAKS